MMSAFASMSLRIVRNPLSALNMCIAVSPVVTFGACIVPLNRTMYPRLFIVLSEHPYQLIASRAVYPLLHEKQSDHLCRTGSHPDKWTTSQVVS
uniref:Secreted protein n=1 Tax=Steinernema glaseri TaxID=37863 RepID=A0A1I8ANZ2_9BILA